MVDAGPEPTYEVKVRVPPPRPGFTHLQANQRVRTITKIVFAWSVVVASIRPVIGQVCLLLCGFMYGGT